MTASYCSACGARLAVGSRFCPGCGVAVDAKPTPSGRRDALGHYRLEGVIAEGGMGVVFRAYDERLERKVALKLLRDDLASDEEFRGRFTRESRGAASLDHPNILPVFDAGEIDGTLYIATRLVEGEDLRRIIAHEGALTNDRALRLVGQIAAALDYAHNHGIVHRDVKPANILVVPGADGEPEHAYLIDFGIIKRANGAGPDVTRAGQFVGTPEYAAPEQILGEEVTGSADQYALGCILFHCLTGHSPYADTSSAAVLQAHLNAPAPHVTAELPDLPATLDAALARAMDKSPAQRFHTCRAFVDAARAGDSRTVVETPRSAAEPAPEPRRRGKQARTLVVAGLVLLGALVAIGVGAVATGAVSLPGGKPSPTPGAVVAKATATATATPKPTRTPRPRPTRTPKPRATEEPVATKVPSLDVGALSLEPRAMKGYRVSLPAEWAVLQDDERQPASGGVVRRRTSVKDESMDTEVVIDHLTHFDTPPATNRSELQADYASKVPGYRFVSDDDYELDGRRIYEWRYDVAGSDGTSHRVDLMFSHGSAAQFAVLASGPPSADDLADLAQAVVKSIAVAPPPARDGRIPDSGVYTGTGTHHSSSGDTSGVALVMRIGTPSTVEYTKRSCQAKLVPTGFDGSWRVYRERFTAGGCDDAGTWKVRKVSSTRLEARWSAPGDPYSVTVDLSR